MKKKALLYITLAPLVYVYGLAENHFNFGETARAYSLEFLYEYLNAWRILFGKEYKDNSVKVSLYEYKTKAKKARFDLDVALLMRELYGTSWLRFYKKERELSYHWSYDSGDNTLNIKQLGEDRFKVGHCDDTGWNRRRYLETDYVLSKENTLDIIKMIKDKK